MRHRRPSALVRVEDMLDELEHDYVLRRDVEDDAPLWEPLPPEPGRGLVCPYTKRRMSPQQMALESQADELFFGGGLGGGKTYLLLGLALTKHRNSIIFRREYSQMRGEKGIIEESKQIIGLRGDFGNSTWRNLPGGRSIEFGGVKDERAMQRYKGRAHDLKCFDELPDFPKPMYQFLIAWARTTHQGQRVRIVGTGNPPMNPEGRWVVQHWGPWLDPQHAHPARPGELRWFASVEDRDVECENGSPVVIGGKSVTPRSRTFIPASVEDNPYYMRTGYAAQLDALPEHMRPMMRYGDFAHASPDHEKQVIPTAWVIAAQARWRPDGGAGKPLTRAGCDPSRGGQDEFVTALLRVDWIGFKARPAKAAPDGITGAQLLARDVMDLDIPVQIDIGGSAGSSVYDQARVLGMSAVAINGSEKSYAKNRGRSLGFYNLRAELYWRMQEALDPVNGMDIALPPDPQLRSDLCATRWELTTRGIKCEDKEEVKKRLGRSPDRGEAVIYACVPIQPKPRQTSAVWGRR